MSRTLLGPRDRRAFTTLRAGLVIVLGSLAATSALGQAELVDANSKADVAKTALFGNPDVKPLEPLRLGPIAGLTTGWHASPSAALIPGGSIILFEQEVPEGATIIWRGATEVSRVGALSLAQAVIPVGVALDIDAEVTLADGYARVQRARFTGFDPAATPIVISGVTAEATGVVADDFTGMAALTAPSIADVVLDGPWSITTSVNREVRVRAQVSPAGFEPLVEWRIPGREPALGVDAAILSRDVGALQFNVGPADAPELVTLNTYRAIITSPAPGADLPDGEAITFTAITDPPGYEDRIVWAAGTRYGAADGALGQGPTHTVIFTGTEGPEGERDVGVRADNVLRGPGAPCAGALGESYEQLQRFVAFQFEVVSITPLGVVTPGTRAALIDLAVNDSFIPILSDSSPATLGVGVIADDPMIPAADLAAYRSGIEASVINGDYVFNVQLSSPTAGPFQTIAFLHQDCSPAFDSFLSHTPCPWPPNTGEDAVCDAAGRDGGGGSDGDDQLAFTRRAQSRTVKLYNGFGFLCEEFTCYAEITCTDSGVKVDCEGTHDAFGYCVGGEARGTSSPRTLPSINCCRNTCNFGYATGFKKVKIGADGITLEIEGILGTGGTFSRTVTVCCSCPTP